MAELDLIPQAYRRARWLHRWLGRLAVSYLVVVLSLGGARVALSHRLQTQSRQIEQLEKAREEVRAQQAELETLASQREELERRLAVLSGLRGGIAAKDMFVVVDRALDSDVWFRDWTFRRAGELVERDPDTVQTGYFVVVPKQKPDEPDRAWRMQTHMEIRGHARTHSAVAGFVRRLSEQAEIESVRILNTQVRRYTNSEVVDFELAILVGVRS